MIQALSDAKPTVRATAIAALTCWFDNCGGLAPFLEGDLLLETLTAASSPNVKAEMCGWLAAVLPKCKKLPPELKAIIPAVFTYVEDRNPEVRTKSQELMVPLMMHVGPNDMLRALQKACLFFFVANLSVLLLKSSKYFLVLPCIYVTHTYIYNNNNNNINNINNFYYFLRAKSTPAEPR
jgi:hypothetical protein